MKIDSLDHLVLTVADLGRTVAFYEAVLGMEHREAGGRHSLHFGSQKINLHERGHEFEPKANHPTPGSGDLCFITTVPIAEVMAHLSRCEVPVEVGPVERDGASGPLLSVYIRDPDGNLVEVSNCEGARTDR